MDYFIFIDKKLFTLSSPLFPKQESDRYSIKNKNRYGMFHLAFLQYKCKLL